MQTSTAVLATAQAADGCGKRRRDDRETASLRAADVVLVSIYCLSAAQNVWFDVSTGASPSGVAKSTLFAKATSGCQSGSSGSLPAVYQV